MTTRVIVGCSSIRDYQFLAPLTGLVWRHVVGFEPVFFLTGSWHTEKRSQIARQALGDHDFAVVATNPSKKYPEGTMAQNVRQHAPMMAMFDDDEWLMSSDVDLWPVTRYWYWQHQPVTPTPDTKRAYIYYSNGDHYQTYPTCHVAMKRIDWLRVYGLTEGIGLEAAIEASLDKWIPENRGRWPDDPNFAVWMSDQAMMTDKLKVQDWHPDDCELIERKGHPPLDRIDRGAWPKDVRIQGKIDAHLLRPADRPDNWPRVRELFSLLVPSKTQWAEEYRTRYFGSYES